MDFSSIFSEWKSPFVTRNQLYDLTGGMIHPKTIRNLDSLGEGIKGKFAIGRRKVAYPVNEVIAWLNDRYNKVNTPTAAVKNEVFHD
jgi:hypothetical protein